MKITRKKKSSASRPKPWTMKDLYTHLQAAVDLEFWTIPFYMSAMYSIEDRTSDAYQLIRTVVNQEMLHLQCAANIANAYGLSPTLKAPVYKGKKVPHLDFFKDDPKEIKKFLPYTAEIGALDLKHINAMCLIEIPEDLTGHKPNLQPNIEDYGSIGEFYEALRYGASKFKKHIKGGVRQVDFFSAFYRNMPSMTITEANDDGFDQVDLLIDLITDQGEGTGKKGDEVVPAFQNTADDIAPEDDHFDKFLNIKNSKNKFPKVFTAKPRSKYTAADKKLEKILIGQFTALSKAMEGLFSGENPQDFFPLMASVGGAIRNCWEHKVTPKFS